MNSKYMYQSANIFLRLFNILLKFALTFVIAKIITTKELGIYGTILATITLSVYILGWEVWYFYNRELTPNYKNDIQKTIKVLTDHFFSYFILYICFIPLIIFYSLKNYDIYWAYIVIIIVTLHLSQEMSRIYTHINQHLLASTTTLLVQSGWIVVLLYYFYTSKELNLNSLLEINAQYASFFMLITILFFIKIMQIKFKYIQFGFRNFSFTKIVTTIINSTKFLVSVMFFLLGIVIGRFFLENLGLLELTGVYSYFQNIASVSMVIVNFGLTALTIPKLLQNKDDINNHRLMLKSFFFKTMYFSFFVFLFMSLATYFYVYSLLEKKIFCQYFYVFILINFAYFLINLNSYYSSILYVWKKDWEVVMSNTYSFLSVVPLFGLLYIVNYPIELVTGIFIIWSIINLFVKKRYAKKVLNDISY